MQPRLLVLTDLDGSLLDADTYSVEPAQEALDTLRSREIPVILVSSKTRREIEEVRAGLSLHHPFISENGGAVFMPCGYFSDPSLDTMVRGNYEVLELGTPTEVLRVGLRLIEQTVGCPLRGFGDMTVEEIAERTGLSLKDAELAKQREYDEPFCFDESLVSGKTVAVECERRGFHCTQGGRFYHLLKGTDKGKACRFLVDRYRQEYRTAGQPVVTIGLGDSLNDLPMLAIVDHPVLLQRPDRTYAAGVTVPHLTLAHGIGPVGWNDAIMEFLRSHPVS
jgi:mannosyl-3-phosphoglycerate phosphatase